MAFYSLVYPAKQKAACIILLQPLLMMPTILWKYKLWSGISDGYRNRMRRTLRSANNSRQNTSLKLRAMFLEYVLKVLIKSSCLYHPGCSPKRREKRGIDRRWCGEDGQDAWADDKIPECLWFRLPKLLEGTYCYGCRSCQGGKSKVVIKISTICKGNEHVNTPDEKAALSWKALKYFFSYASLIWDTTRGVEVGHAYTKATDQERPTPEQIEAQHWRNFETFGMEVFLWVYTVECYLFTFSLDIG